MLKTNSDISAHNKSKNFELFVSIRRLLNSIFAKFAFLDNSDIVVLCYHSIANDDWTYSINLEQFKKQVDFLLKSRVPITADNLYSFIKSRARQVKRSFLITFDDGYKDIIGVKKYLDEKGIKPIVFIIADNNRANSAELETNRPFLTKKNILSLYKSGWEIGCHSATHPDFKKLNSSELKDEIICSKNNLEKIGVKVNYFAYPKGVYNKTILELVRAAGYNAAFSMDGNFISKDTDILKVPRVGVDRTHKLSEFPGIYSIPTILIRRLLI